MPKKGEDGMRKVLTIFILLGLFISITFINGLTAEAEVLKISGLDGGWGTAHWEEIAARFEAANPGVEVELTMKKNIAEVLRPQIIARNYPDIINLSVGSEGGLVDALIKEKGIMDITDLLEMEVPGEGVKVGDKIIPGFTDTYITNPYGDGRTYLAPLFYSPCGLFYNKDLFGEGKYKLPETWDEFFELGEVAEGDGIYLFTYPTAGYFDAFFYALLNEVGGPELYNRCMNYDVEAWESPEAIKAFELVGRLARYIHPDTVAQANVANFTKNQQLILDNKALFIPNGTWLPNEMKDAPRAEGFEWGFTALPKLTEDGEAYSHAFFEQMFIPKGAKNVELARKFMAFMYTDESAEIIYEKCGAVQPVVGASDLMTDDDPNRLFYTIYDSGAKASMGTFAAAPPVAGVQLTGGSGVLLGTINSLVNGEVTVEEWHQDVVRAVERIREAIDAQ